MEHLLQELRQRGCRLTPQRAAILRAVLDTDLPELVALGKQLGLNLLHGKCILMYAEPVRSFHKWHRGFMKLIGKL